MGITHLLVMITALHANPVKDASLILTRIGGYKNAEGCEADKSFYSKPALAKYQGQLVYIKVSEGV
ncbi:MAG: hypothetical protein H7836_17395 [Magnetococcus sp. YQC-3]